MPGVWIHTVSLLQMQSTMTTIPRYLPALLHLWQHWPGTVPPHASAEPGRKQGQLYSGKKCKNETPFWEDTAIIHLLNQSTKYFPMPPWQSPHSSVP